MFGFSPHGDSVFFHLAPSSSSWASLHVYSQPVYEEKGTQRGNSHCLIVFNGESFSWFLLTSHWSERVMWPLITARQAEKCSLDMDPRERTEFW